MALTKPLDEVVNFLLMDPVVLLPALPRVMWVLNWGLSDEWDDSMYANSPSAQTSEIFCPMYRRVCRRKILRAARHLHGCSASFFRGLVGVGHHFQCD